jgi:hypothetical protein
MVGEWDVAQMRREMPVAQWLDWKEYHKREPFGPLRDNRHAALIAKAIYDVNGVEIDGHVVSTDDLMLVEQKPKAPETKEEMRERAKRMAAVARVITETWNRELAAEQRRYHGN